MLFSVGGILLGALIIQLLTYHTFFQKHEYFSKAISMGVVFLYNFYTKQFVFEKNVKL